MTVVVDPTTALPTSGLEAGSRTRPIWVEALIRAGKSLFSGGSYIGEGLDPSAEQFFTSVNEDTISSFLVENPDFLQKL